MSSQFDTQAISHLWQQWQTCQRVLSNIRAEAVTKHMGPHCATQQRPLNILCVSGGLDMQCLKDFQLHKTPVTFQASCIKFLHATSKTAHTSWAVTGKAPVELSAWTASCDTATSGIIWFSNCSTRCWHMWKDGCCYSCHPPRNLDTAACKVQVKLHCSSKTKTAVN